MYILVVMNNVYYVDGANGDDANGGTGWRDAFATIGKALSVAGDYDLVLVADATYNETDMKFDGKKIYLKGVDHNNAGAQPVIDCQGKGRAFYFGSGETKDSVIDNFTIQNGTADDGGAIYCDSSSPTITNCTFSDNSEVGLCEGGGAIYCENSSLTVTNCSFSNNSCDAFFAGGGAIFCESSSPSIANCTFSGNTAPNFHGGAIFCRNSSSPTITSCTFNGNSADLYGGAIFCRDSSSPTIINCTFSDDSVRGTGGAIYCLNSSSPSITNCAFSGNSAGAGGAIGCLDGSRPTITNCTFSGNSADWGGAISCDSSSPTLSNCAFNGNGTLKGHGGAIYCANSSSLTITNCTFSGNSADNGGAIDCYDSSSPTVNNCILWNNSAGSAGNQIHIEDSGSSCTLNYCCVDNTGYGGQTGNITENNCIHSDPQFVDAANGDYHLKDTSPCIDRGNNTLVPSGVTTDLDGNPRIVNGIVDIGAYEYQP
ncbi:MAG: hypothetical protein DRP63_06095 [Planctomycetota bacterium]|nr:MAG: hypothetical protein DRP63_06095 [Planctomycetota bacterium]